MKWLYLKRHDRDTLGFYEEFCDENGDLWDQYATAMLEAAEDSPKRQRGIADGLVNRSGRAEAGKVQKQIYNALRPYLHYQDKAVASAARQVYRITQSKEFRAYWFGQGK